MALMYSQMIPLGTACPPFALRGIDNATHTLETYNQSKILVLIIMCNHCPYVQAQWSRFVALQTKYSTADVQLIGVNANDAAAYPEDSFENMKRYAQQYAMNFPYLYDADQTFARALGAVCTPDIFVFDQSRVLVYRGRLDDNWEHPDQVRMSDLKNVLDMLLAGETVAMEQKPSQGCSIKWKV